MRPWSTYPGLATENGETLWRVEDRLGLVHEYLSDVERRMFGMSTDRILLTSARHTEQPGPFDYNAHHVQAWLRARRAPTREE